MRAAVHRVDVVGEGEDGLGVGVVVLQADLHGDAVALGLHVDGLVVQHLLAAVEVLDELGDATRVLEELLLGFAGLGVGGALVGERDLQALVEEGKLAQALGKRVVVELGDGEDGAVGQEVDLGAELLGWLHAAQLADGRALAVVLLPCIAVAPDFDVQLLTERVDATDADAVQAVGDLVVGGVELAAGVQLGQHHLDGGHLDAVGDHVVHRNAAAVVHHGDGVVDVDGDIDARGVSGQRLVDRVVHHLVDQVVQAQLAGRSNVHGGTQADGCEAFEHGDIFGGVSAAVLFGIVLRAVRNSYHLVGL